MPTGHARAHASVSTVLVTVAIASGLATVRAQDIEPRAYSNAPVGVNFLIGGYAYTRGGIATDDSVPITDPHLHTSNAVVAFAHGLNLWECRREPPTTTICSGWPGNTAGAAASDGRVSDLSTRLTN